MLAPWDIVVMLAILTFWIGAIVLLALGAMHTQYHVHWCVGPRVLVVRPFLQGRKQIRLDDKKGFMVYSGVSLQRGSVIVRRKKGLPFVISSGIGASDMDLHRFIDEVNARMRAIQIDAMEREP